MAEYIRREDALDCLKRYPTGKYAGENLYCAEIRAAADDINDLPSADVVEVVRCKDCLFAHRGMLSDMTKEVWCTYWQKTEGKAWNVMHFNDFCSHGEKEE